jgi:anti-sigma-K factor RskA
MEAMYCQQQEMYILISVSGTNCLIDLNVQMSLLNLTVSQDIIRTQFVVGALNFMRETPADQRMSFLENIANSIEKSIAQIQQLNSGLRAHITAAVLLNYAKKEEQRVAQTFARNRYNR